VADEQGTITVADRLRASGLSDERIAWWFTQEPGAVRVGDEPVTSPDAPAPRPMVVVLRS
jgi:hypothetical protein